MEIYVITVLYADYKGAFCWVEQTCHTLLEARIALLRVLFERYSELYEDKNELEQFIKSNYVNEDCWEWDNSEDLTQIQIHKSSL